MQTDDVEKVRITHDDLTASLSFRGESYPIGEGGYAEIPGYVFAALAAGDALASHGFRVWTAPLIEPAPAGRPASGGRTAPNATDKT